MACLVSRLDFGSTEQKPASHPQLPCPPHNPTQALWIVSKADFFFWKIKTMFFCWQSHNNIFFENELLLGIVNCPSHRCPIFFPFCSPNKCQNGAVSHHWWKFSKWPIQNVFLKFSSSFPFVVVWFLLFCGFWSVFICFCFCPSGSCGGFELPNSSPFFSVFSPLR